ncbi:DUF2190 family protein [Xenorhabdus ehlersii]|uniref:Uncharacterized protein DUF2190 n=1 Tax=Xenorhabdus ehlersii TaxID=290111 RepID=A0A2D0IRV8_9GAMM|nr:DUF2190 family protein [Xenorhabdus ehlersii]PHM24588.1 hypothetical protein Xehl_01838 [Xenorhabdus ehlersii]RKE91227.1 uncharacterized protein DUF2190 [Xenorhabdus ehlersii]
MAITQQPVLTTTVVATASIIQHRLVGADNAPCQAGAAALGVAEVDAKTGDAVPVNVLGIIAVEAGAPIARGQVVQSDKNACAVPRAAENATVVSVGLALDEATAAGNVIRILRGV